MNRHPASTPTSLAFIPGTFRVAFTVTSLEGLGGKSISTETCRTVLNPWEDVTANPAFILTHGYGEIRLVKEIFFKNPLVQVTTIVTVLVTLATWCRFWSWTWCWPFTFPVKSQRLNEWAYFPRNMPEVAPLFCPDGLLGTYPFPIATFIDTCIGFKLKSGDYVSIVVARATRAMIKCHTNDMFSFFEVKVMMIPSIISKVIARNLSISITQIYTVKNIIATK